MEIYELIKEAIEQKKQVYADYKGHRREMCPHILGTKNNIRQALFYQFGGSSKTGLKKNGRDWKCMKLDDLENVSVKEGEWHTGVVITDQRSTCVDDIHFEVERE